MLRGGNKVDKKILGTSIIVNQWLHNRQRHATLSQFLWFSICFYCFCYSTRLEISSTRPAVISDRNGLNTRITEVIHLGDIDQCVSFLWFIQFFVLCFFHVLLSMCSIFVREKCFYMLSLPPGSQFFFWARDASWVKSSGLLSTFFFCPFFLTFLVLSVQSLEFRIEITLFESHQINMMLQKQIDLPSQSNFNKPRSERSHASIC